MSSIGLPYLGFPGAMTQLPGPTGFSAPVSLGEAAHTMLSGGTAASFRINPKRTYTLTYENPLSAAQVDVLEAYHMRMFGPGPYVFVDATVRNVLGFDVASCGARSFANPGWAVSSGNLSPSTLPPSQAPTSGVLRWGSPGAAGVLQPGTVTTAAPTGSAPVYLPGEALTESLWVRFSSSQTATFQIAGFDATGAPTGTPVAWTGTVGTTWQQLTVSAAAGAAGVAAAAFTLPQLVMGSTAPGAVFFAAAQVEYASSVSAWQLGQGSPRVIIPSTPGRDVPIFGYANQTLVLGEV